jgi:hypothetical protein
METIMGKGAILLKRMDPVGRKKRAAVVGVFDALLNALPTYEAIEVTVVRVRGPYAWVKSKGREGIYRVDFKDLVSKKERGGVG